MENNPGLNEDEFPRFKSKKEEKPLSEEEQMLQWRKEIDENKALQEYFSGYDLKSVESFKDRWMESKKDWVKYGNQLLPVMDDAKTGWVTTAYEHLKVIQQKKLFDKQCLWRAEQIAIKEVEICFDFQFWGADVLNCPFIDSVNETDIELYQHYLQTENVDLEYDQWFGWQDYEALKLAWEDDDNSSIEFPDYYDFHNNHTGASMLMKLPDLREPKEQYYYGVVRQHTNDTVNQAEQEIKKPYIIFPIRTDLIDFVETFESQEIRRLFEAYKWHENKQNKKEDLYEDLELLFSADEPVPAPASNDWQKSIKLAANQYRRIKIAEAIPAAWEQYMININTGIAFHRKKFGAYDSKKRLRQMYVDAIIKGRELNGEPADLNF